MVQIPAWKSNLYLSVGFRSSDAMNSRKVVMVSLDSQGNNQKKNLGSKPLPLTEGKTLHRDRFLLELRLHFSSQPLISRGEKEWKLPSCWLPDPSVCLTLAKQNNGPSYQAFPPALIQRPHVTHML